MSSNSDAFTNVRGPPHEAVPVHFRRRRLDQRGGPSSGVRDITRAMPKKGQTDFDSEPQKKNKDVTRLMPKKGQTDF